MYEIVCYDKYGNSIDEFVQWDTNLMLYIDWGHDCIPIFQFGNTRSDRLLVVKGRIFENDGRRFAEVNVPNILLQQSFSVVGFVYLETEADGNEGYFSGKTVYSFKIPVRPKEKPEDYKFQENTEYISWVNLEAEAKTYLAELEISTNQFKEEYKTSLDSIGDNVNKALLAAADARGALQNAVASELESQKLADEAKLSEIASKEYESSAKQYKDSAFKSETNSKSSETNAKISEMNAKSSEEIAKTSETNAKISEMNALVSEENAKLSELNVVQLEKKVSDSKIEAKSSESYARMYYNGTAKLYDEVHVYASELKNNATIAKSYAVGDTGYRPNENIDNAKYYYSQIKNVQENLSGAFLSPQGTIEFSELHLVEKEVGYVYHIKDAFVTDDTFKSGAGISYPMGTNVYYTQSGLWDCLVEKKLSVVDDGDGNVEIVCSYDFVTTYDTPDGLGNMVAKLQERIEVLEKQSVLAITE